MNDEFIQNIITFRGDAGKRWLARIPKIIKSYEKLWNLRVLPPYPLTYNYVAPVQLSDGSDAVLKIGFPGDKEFREGIEALKLFNGNGASKLLREDKDNDVILLEKISPGIPLRKETDDKKATIIAATLMKRLWIPMREHAGVSKLFEWGRGVKRIRQRFHDSSGPFPKDLFGKAESLFLALLKSTKHQVLLHGDLHHDNIISSQRQGWLAIDPKGIIGDPVYDIASFLRNPKQILTDTKIEDITKKRIHIFSKELALDKERIKAWGVAHAVLSAIWSFEDHGSGWEEQIAFAKTLMSLSF